MTNAIVGAMWTVLTMGIAAPPAEDALSSQEGRISVPAEASWVIRSWTQQSDPDANAVSWTLSSGRTVELVVNKKAHTYYGYEVRKRREGVILHVAFVPLGPDFVAQWLESGWNTVCPGCPAPSRVPLDYSQLPRPQAFHEGDTYRFEMALDDGSGRKVSETFRFETQKDLPPARVRMESAVLVVNDRPRRNVASCEGELVYFFVGKRGRYFVSATRRDGFERIGVLVGNVLEFAWGPDQFRWIASTPVIHLPGTPADSVVKTRLWVKFDASWINSPPPDAGTYGAGGLSTTKTADR